MTGTEAQTVALVTGANRGIGLEAARQLARKGVRVILTARNATQGQAATEALKAQGLNVDFIPLDITDAASIEHARTTVEKTYGHLDILINNAGVMLDFANALTVSQEALKQTFDINTFGPLRVAQAFVPLLKKSPRAQIINVSSGYGSLSDMESGPAAYIISKTALNAVTKILATDLKKFSIAVNAICPGWVRTDMGGPQATRPVEEGAKGIVDLALLEKNVPTGQFLRDLQVVDW